MDSTSRPSLNSFELGKQNLVNKRYSHVVNSLLLSLYYRLFTVCLPVFTVCLPLITITQSILLTF